MTGNKDDGDGEQGFRQLLFGCGVVILVENHEFDFKVFEDGFNKFKVKSTESVAVGNHNC
jgi:hypothetical protein